MAKKSSSTSRNKRIVTILRFLGTATAGLIMIVAILVLVGWRLDLPTFKSIFPKMVTMKPNTAFGFILLSSGMLLLRFEVARAGLYTTGIGLVLLASLSVSQDVLGWEAGIDELMFLDDPAAIHTGAPGRMSPITAVCFLLTGFALLLSHHALALGQTLVVIVGFVGYFAVASYLFGVERLQFIETATAMALHTAILFAIAPVAFWFCGPLEAMAGAFANPGSAGRIARRLLPVGWAVPLIGGVLVVGGEHFGWFSARFGESLIAVITSALYCLLAWWLISTITAYSTERSGLQKSLGKTGRALESKKKELEQFAFTVSHDLKSPLVSIRGFLGLMLEDLESGDIDAAKDSATEVTDAAKHMSEIIDDLLSYSRIGRVDELFEQINMEELIETIIELHRPESDPLNITIKLQRPLPDCVGHPNAIRRAMENLYTNAIKYAGDTANAKIEVGGLAVGDEIRYFVRDNGPGIAPEYHESIFRLFQRANTEKPGTGLGLASVAKIAEVHRGRAWVESVPGETTTFWFAVPATPDGSLQ